MHMKSLLDIASALRARAKRMSLTQAQLGEAAGISRRTLTHALSGTHDVKVTTLIAVADRLGLELALVPKEAAYGMPAPDEFGVSQPAVKTRIQYMLEQDKGPRGPGSSSGR